jgi:hypothetical protein
MSYNTKIHNGYGDTANNVYPDHNEDNEEVNARERDLLKMDRDASEETESSGESLEFSSDVKMSARKAETEKIKFTSTFSTYMTLIGFSVGMSDFWRFPFLAYRNGGGKILFYFFATTKKE